jgi:hypothetical protein
MIDEDRQLFRERSAAHRAGVLLAQPRIRPLSIRAGLAGTGTPEAPPCGARPGSVCGSGFCIRFAAIVSCFCRYPVFPLQARKIVSSSPAVVMETGSA